MLLELEDVVVAYGRIEALHGISIGIDEGEVVALIGANGAGKTTTMRAISGLRALSSGRIRFDGEDISRLRADLRVRRYDGWKAQWGLPRPSLVGLRAGSCMRIIVTGGPVDPSRLAEIETKGLGERRAEGFG